MAIVNNEFPEQNTDFQLLVALVPDIEKKLVDLKVERPGIFGELAKRAIENPDGWRPLHWWRGCL